MPKKSPKKHYDVYQKLKTQDPEGLWNGMVVYVVEPETGKVHVNVGGEITRDPASLNKLMMFNLVQEALSQQKIYKNEIITVDMDAAAPDPKKREGKGLKLIKDAQLTVDEMLNAMMTGSDNGAAIMLGRFLEQKSKHIYDSRSYSMDIRVTTDAAQPDKKRVAIDTLKASHMDQQLLIKALQVGKATGLSEESEPTPKKFILRQMNNAAKDVGMVHTRYINVSGYPSYYDQYKQLKEKDRPKNWDKDKSQNRTTAEDVAKLMTHLTEKYPEQMHAYMSNASVTYCDFTEKAHHRLQQTMPKDYEADVKTGYTVRAGYNSASRMKDPDNRQLIVIVMGGHDMPVEALKAMGLKTKLALPKKGNIKGAVIRDILAQQVALDEIEKMREKEKTPPVTAKEKVGFVSPELLDLPWKPEPKLSTPIRFDGEFSEARSQIVKPAVNHDKTSQTLV